jgi:hypothetical protein
MLSLTAPNLDNSLPASWAASRINGGTPKAASGSTLAGKTAPQLTITAPSGIIYGATLPIDATASAGGAPVAGSFSYNPPLNTVLNAGADQPVQVIFTPSDASTYVGVNERGRG